MYAGVRVCALALLQPWGGSLGPGWAQAACRGELLAGHSGCPQGLPAPRACWRLPTLIARAARPEQPGPSAAAHVCSLAAFTSGTVPAAARPARSPAAQEAGGDWPQQHISGVFNRNCMITYANYR